MNFSRYALYFTPPPGPLAALGAAWLGWDPVAGRAVAHPAMPGVPAPIAEITREPRRYGLHATMKPPFRLAEGQTADALEAAFARFCAHGAPVVLDGLTVAPLGRFLALVPEGDTSALDALAAATVRTFDPFRAPPTAAELARRRTAGFSPAEEALLVQWGYPYVMEAFRFHITLTGRMPRADIPGLRDMLAEHLRPHLARPFRIDALSLAGEDETGRFHVIHRHPLAG